MKALVKKIGKPPTKAQRAVFDRERELILELGLKAKGK
jgi:hypothetical protein